jgi:hypothetical protein
MVQILAPAGWLAAGEAVPNPAAAEVAAVGSPTLSEVVVNALREHAVLWSTGAAAAVMASGLVAFLALRGGEEVVALPPTPPAVEERVAGPSEVEKQREQRSLPLATEVRTAEQTVETTPPAPIRPPQVKIETAGAEEKPLVVPPPKTAVAPVVKQEQPRTLTLEPVRNDANAATVRATAVAVPDYPPAMVTEVAQVETKPRTVTPPARVTNFADQLAVPIESIDMPAMRIGEFVNLASDMAAVPIKLDAKVLGEVGLSTRSTVTVRADDTTVGKLLARVLKEHQLTCVERDGVLVVVKAKR